MKQAKIFMFLSILFFFFATFLFIRGLIVFESFSIGEFAQASLVVISAQIQSSLFYILGFISLIYSLSLFRK